VPLALDTYWAYQKPLASLVGGLDLAVLAAAALAAFAARRREGVSEWCAGFAVASASGYLAFLLGGTDWPYHALPFRSFALACVAGVGLSVAARARAAAPSRLRALAAFAVAAALCVLAVRLLPWNIGRTLRDGDAWRQFSVGIWQELLAQHAPGGALLSLSSALPPAFPLVNYAGVEWSSRYSCQWMLPALVRARAGRAARPLAPERIDAIERSVLDALVADLEAMPPALVLVDVRPHKPAFAGLPFEYLRYFSRDARFRRIWSAYRRAGTLAGYDYYVRAGADVPAPAPADATTPP
jgi:hypothetical protein